MRYFCTKVCKFFKNLLLCKFPESSAEW